MKTFLRCIVFSLLVALACASGAFAASCCEGAVCGTPPVAENSLSAQEKADGWQLLFDGKTFDGWLCQNVEHNAWQIDTGAFYYDAKGHGMLYTKARYGNFELKIDFMCDKGTNSGVFFRWDKISDPVQTGFEMQVLDDANSNDSPRHWCGAIYDVMAPSEHAVNPMRTWNTAVIRARDNFISVTLNGKHIVQMDLNRWTEAHKNPDGSTNKFNTAYKDMPREGHIGLQNHGCKVWFKNIKLRVLK